MWAGLVGCIQSLMLQGLSTDVPTTSPGFKTARLALFLMTAVSVAIGLKLEHNSFYNMKPQLQ